ncbi:DUF47 family protein [Candidatus Margulisiibacteriota bacterium]
MFDKYFGMINLYDEQTILDSFINLTKIEKEKINILLQLVTCICDNPEKIKNYYQKIREIHQESKQINKNITTQIIEANFNQKKQHDLLRLYQRIEKFSELIMATAKRVLILDNIDSCFPKEIKKDILDLMILVKNIHLKYIEILEKYKNDSRNTMPLINQIDEMENHIDHKRSQCLENLYILGNANKLQMGTFRVIEDIVEHLESTADAIEETAKSIEWLLLP